VSVAILASIFTLPLSGGGKLTEVSEPGTVTDCASVGGLTATDSVGMVFVEVSIFAGAARLDARLTFIAVFADSSVPWPNIRNKTAIIATPKSPRGINAHGGNPEPSLRGCVTTILSSDT